MAEVLRAAIWAVVRVEIVGIRSSVPLVVQMDASAPARSYGPKSAQI